MQQFILNVIRSKQINSAHDVSEGGLLVCLLESAFPNGVGFNLKVDEGAFRKDAFWFGEAQSRVVVSISPTQKDAFIATAAKANISITELGTIGGTTIEVNGESLGKVEDYKDLYDHAIGKIMERPSVESVGI